MAKVADCKSVMSRFESGRRLEALSLKYRGLAAFVVFNFGVLLAGKESQ